MAFFMTYLLGVLYLFSFDVLAIVLDVNDSSMPLHPIEKDH